MYRKKTIRCIVLLIIIINFISNIYSESPFDFGSTKREAISFSFLYDLKKSLNNEFERKKLPFFVDEVYLYSSTAADIFQTQRINISVTINKKISKNSYETDINSDGKHVLYNEPVADVYLMNSNNYYANSNFIYVSDEISIEDEKFQVGIMYSDKKILDIVLQVLKRKIKI